MMRVYFGRHYTDTRALFQTNLTDRVDLNTLRCWYIVAVLGPFKLDICGNWSL